MSKSHGATTNVAPFCRTSVAALNACCGSVFASDSTTLIFRPSSPPLALMSSAAILSIFAPSPS